MAEICNCFNNKSLICRKNHSADSETGVVFYDVNMIYSQSMPDIYLPYMSRWGTGCLANGTASYQWDSFFSMG